MTSPRRLLSEYGLAAKKNLGQNFLVDPNLARKIVEKTEAAAGDAVLEIGPGLGALTRPLLEKGARVTAVEVDQGLCRYLRNELAPFFPASLTLMENDILEVDLAGLAEQNGGPVIVVGNLPYQVSTPLLFKLLEARSAVVRAVLMFQRELAARLTASPGNKEYGRLSVHLGYYARLEKLMTLGPESFFPRPQVGSTLLRLVFKTEPAPALRSPEFFSRVVAAGFAQRRKMLKNALGAAFSEMEVEAALSRAGIDPKRRAETLTVEEFAHLANVWPAE